MDIRKNFFTVRVVTGHFAYGTLRLLVISPTRHFAYWTVCLLQITHCTHLILFYFGSLVDKMKSNL